MLEKELPTCSLFDNLVTLEIGGWCLTNDLYVVVRFLQLSPRLEKLTLQQRKVCFIQIITAFAREDQESVSLFLLFAAL
jgi:hypothetical protein